MDGTGWIPGSDRAEIFPYAFLSRLVLEATQLSLKLISGTFQSVKLTGAYGQLT